MSSPASNYYPPYFYEEIVSEQTGSRSTARKKSLIVSLMRSCREKEMKFLVRTLVSNLRNCNDDLFLHKQTFRKREHDVILELVMVQTDC